MSEAGPPALAGLRVLDLSRLLPGGYCTMLMADLGADVIKVEEPGTGDALRYSPPYTAAGESGPNLLLNRGKRSVTCNLRAEEGRAFLRDLVRTADVLVESYRPGVMARHGLGYDALREVNPGLVYVAITAYGSDGPYAQRAGHDLNCLGYAGVLSLAGTAAHGPTLPGVQIADLSSGMHALIAALAALRVRDTTGAGQYCDVAMTDAALSLLTMVAAAYGAAGEVPGFGTAPLAGRLAGYGTYRCADGRYLTSGGVEPKFFGQMCVRIGAPELAELQYDRERQDELRERLAAVFATRPRDDWLELLAEHDTCVGPVNDLAEAFADANARARGVVEDVPLPGGSVFPQVTAVPRLTASPGRPGGPPSALGADTDKLLTELGRTPEEIAAARAAGAV
jgi:alpha-methylacyl-CoA racemase